MKTHTFRGGIYPREMKELSSGCPIEAAFPSSKTVSIPVTMGGAPNAPLVKVGDVVKRGQLIAKSDKYELSSVDCGLLAQNIMLSAQSLGIGSCCLGSSARWLKSSPSAKACLDKLNFSPGHELFFCIALGYPDQEKQAKPRRKDMIQYIEQ